MCRAHFYSGIVLHFVFNLTVRCKRLPVPCRILPAGPGDGEDDNGVVTYGGWTEIKSSDTVSFMLFIVLQNYGHHEYRNRSVT